MIYSEKTKFYIIFYTLPWINDEQQTTHYNNLIYNKIKAVQSWQIKLKGYI